MIDIEINLASAEEKMESSIIHLDETLSRIRAGKANARILDGVKVDYYGSMTPLSSVATISVPDARTIAIQPWEKGLIKDIEKALLLSDIGINPDNNGEIIRLMIPPVTEDRRKELVKIAKKEGEDAKIGIRGSRRDAIDALKKSIKDGLSEDLEKDAEAEVQNLHDAYVKKIDALISNKEKEILTV